MIRVLAVVSLVVVAGCADPSKGAALNECRMEYYLDSSDVQTDRIRDCMQAKSFQAIVPCSPHADPHEWDTLVSTYAYNNAQCYQPQGSEAWIASALSPL